MFNNFLKIKFYFFKNKIYTFIGCYLMEFEKRNDLMYIY